MHTASITASMLAVCICALNKMGNFRSRNFSLISYIDNEDKLKNILFSKTNIAYYAYIYHDKDIYEDGTPKEPHFHIALILRCARDIDCVCNYFRVEDKNGLKVNCLGQITHSNKDICVYFTHINEPDKYQYDFNDVKSNNVNKFLIDNQEDVCILIIDDILKGVTTYEMVKRYGKEFVYRYNNYKAIVTDIIIEKENSRCIHYEIN